MLPIEEERDLKKSGQNLIYVSGRIASQIELSPEDLRRAAGTGFAAATNHEIRIWQENRDVQEDVMEDSSLLGNGKIEEAISRLNGVQCRENMLAVLEAIRYQMNQNGCFLVPVEASQESVCERAPESTGRRKILREKGQGQVPAYQKEERQVTLRKMRMRNGDECLAAFTGRSEAGKGPRTPVIAYAVSAFLKSVLRMEGIAGVALNPWGTGFYLPKDMIRMILQVNREIGAENHVRLVRGDITQLDCECIVNAANESLLGGGGVDGAIHRAAGPGLLKECRSLQGCPTGKAKITGGYRLKAAYVIHTVGPVYSGKKADQELLAACYRNSLVLARKHEIHSIAFPAISTGAYGYPLEEAVMVAMLAVTRWLEENEGYGMTVIFSCFDKKTFDAFRAFIGDCGQGDT